MRSTRTLFVLALIAVLFGTGCGSEVPEPVPSLLSGAAGKGQGDVGSLDASATDGASAADGSAGADGSAATDAAATDGEATQDVTAAQDSGAKVDGGVLDASVSDASPTPDATPDTAPTPDTTPTPDATPDATPDTAGPDVADTAGPDVAPPVCGDVVCDAGESCAFDCSPTAQKLAPCASGKCGTSLTACQASPACVAAIGVVVGCLDACKPGDLVCQGLCQGKIGTNPQAIEFGNCVLAQGCLGSGGGGYCGDGQCNGIESALTCPTDCKPAPTGPYCGDNTCDGKESGKSCPIDCDKDGKKA
ncbi:MAG: hypothetical protein RIT45_2098, partial [Pseudomonadota bacterium]